MEPKREHGDDRVMWRVTNRAGDWCVVEHEGDAKDIAGEDGDYEEDDSRTIDQVLVTAEEWNAMPDFEGW